MLVIGKTQRMTKVSKIYLLGMNGCTNFVVIYPIGPEIFQSGQSGGLSDCP